MKQFDYKGYKVTIFFSYLGTQVFINDAKGVQVYAHKVSENPVARAEEFINRQQ